MPTSRVGFVFDVPDPPLAKVDAELVAPAVDERADDRVPARVHRRQPAGPGTAQQAHEKRLGLVVARMADGDDVRIEMRARPIEEGVARAMRSVLERATLAFGALAHVLALDEDGNAKRVGERHAESFVAIRAGHTGRVGLHAKLVVEVSQPGHGQLAGRFELAQQVHERHRVGAARQRRHHARPGARQVVAANRAPNLRDQHGRVGQGGWPGRAAKATTRGRTRAAC